MEEDNAYIDSSWSYLLMCTEPTLYEGLKFARDLIVANVLLRTIIQTMPVRHNVRHSLCLVIGSYLLYYNIGPSFLWTVGLSTFAYMLIILLSFVTKKWRGLLVSISVILFLLLSEVIVVNPIMWQQIRGIQMIAAMKIISVAIELDRNLFKRMLNPVEFGGYIMCPANCILGPWISFHSYNHYLEVRFLSRRWLKITFVNLIIAMFFLELSSCVVPWYIDDDPKVLFSLDLTNWLLAYRDAQSFRMSHYFISYLSIVSMVAAGFGLTNDCHLELNVTKPLYIELPRSLVQVVIYWNMPMHKWLKNYVFKACQPYGQFTAISVTYLVSSLLHGNNFQFSAVLLSIGTFSYLEYNIRHKVASAFNTCCLAHPCTKQCEHKFKKNNLLSVIVNFIYSCMTILQLAYLGVIFESSFAIQESGYSYYHTISKWENLHYFGHYYAACVYFMDLSYLMLFGSIH